MNEESVMEFVYENVMKLIREKGEFDSVTITFFKDRDVVLEDSLEVK